MAAKRPTFDPKREGALPMLATLQLLPALRITGSPQLAACIPEQTETTF